MKSKASRLVKPIIFILPEWKSEELYFLYLKKLLRRRHKIFVLPEESWKIDKNNLQVAKKNIEKRIKNTLINNQIPNLPSKFVKVFVILDADVYNDGDIKKIKSFFKWIEIVFIDPCFERFLIYHYTTSCSSCDTNKSCERELKQYVKNYKKWNEKIFENIAKNYKQAIETLEKCKDNEDILNLLKYLDNL